MWKVMVNNKLVKSYPHEAQAVMYCFMNGYIYSGGYDFDNNWYYFLDDRVQVKEEKCTDLK